MNLEVIKTATDKVSSRIERHKGINDTIAALEETAAALTANDPFDFLEETENDIEYMRLSLISSGNQLKKAIAELQKLAM